MNADTRRALSDFYREEFLRHIEHLQSHGILTDQALVARVCRHFESLDAYCTHADFPALAEALLQHFETLTRLSELSPRQGH